MIVERRANWNALFCQDASHGGDTDAELCSDVAATVSLSIALNNSSSERWCSNGLGARCFREQSGNTASQQLRSQPREVSWVEFQGTADLFYFSESSFGQLDGAKAVQDRIVERVAIEGRLIDEDSA